MSTSSLHIGIYDSHILLRYPPSLKPSLTLIEEINSFYECRCERRMCAFEAERNEFFPSSGVVHVRRENVWRVAAFFGRALRNFYGPKSKNFALLHASAVSDGRRALIFLGHHAWGKSTLLKGFVSEGYAYLADDMVAIHLRDGLVYPTLPVDHSLRFKELSRPVPVGVIFLSRYLPDEETKIEKVETHLAYTFAMENLLNPEAVDEKGLKILLEVLSSAEAYRTRHRSWRDVLSFKGKC